MRLFVLTPQAELDLTEIWDYIAQDNIDTADHILGELEQTMGRLAEMPNMGHIREDLADRRYRFWPVCSYLIVYRAGTKPLQIIRVISGYRDLSNLFA
jgi:plasmid stabilization system protein ParE